MKILGIKFEQNHTISEEFNFFGARKFIKRIEFINSVLNYYWQTCGNVQFQISAESHHE